ncbi:MAG TPA: o-succinylbenzoate synthase [Longimicrobiales bacterium]|nr:o-succinylbenzoate synthase [Longimicrobiales bacterium]
MRIEQVTLRTIALRLREPFRISSGVTRERRILLVFLEGDGVFGVGECVAGEAPNYSYETLETASWVLREHLAPAVLGVEFSAATELPPRLDRAAKGHRMARAALEMAAWDAEARSRDISLSRLLGGSQDAVPAGVSIGIQDDPDRLLEIIAGYLDQGYRRIKLKIEPGRDVEVLERVRDRYPEITLTVDANAAYGRDDLDRLASLDRFGLMLVEQPFPEDDLLLHAELQQRMETPVCLDESITSPARCREALHLDAGRVVNIKPGRVGGHGPSREIHDLCADAGVPVWCGGMLESGIGRAHNVALASLPNMKLPNDTSASARYWERDVVTPEFRLQEDGTVRVPQGPGIGVELDEDFLRAIEV